MASNGLSFLENTWEFASLSLWKTLLSVDV